MKSRKNIKKALKSSVAHWERMISFVKRLDPAEAPDRILMQVNIMENWSEEFCPLCNIFPINSFDKKCIPCPLYTIGEYCDNFRMDTLWKDVTKSSSWKEWLEYANEMLIVLKELYKVW
jgi:hypothetical protein